MIIYLNNIIAHKSDKSLKTRKLVKRKTSKANIMKNLNRKFTIFIIFTIISSINTGVSSYLGYCMTPYIRDSIKLDNLNPSASEITILTPENTTYYEPMSGYYPATYGFENDTIGAEPSGLDIEINTSCSIQVVEEIAGHKNVLEIHDGYVSAEEAQIIVESPCWAASNWFEFYVRIPTSDDPFVFGIYYGSPGRHATITMHGGSFTYNDGQAIFDAFSINKWVHIKIRHTPTSWFLYHEGRTHGPFSYEVMGGLENRYVFGTSEYMSNYDVYMDALGFATDNNYTIGNNLNEGLLLSYSNSTNMERMGYSLDGRPNNTISGNKVIPMPELGTHSIILSGTNSTGSSIQSNLRYFTVAPEQPIAISLVTPENTIYTSPMAGYYPGSYGFENEIDGAIGDLISFIDTDLSGSNCTPTIIPIIENHKKVLGLIDNNGSSDVDIRHSFRLTPTSGTIEWYWRSTNVDYNSYFDVTNNGSALIRIAIMNNFFQYWNGTYQSILAITSDTWYHLRIDFECENGGYEGLSANTYYLHIGEMRYGPFNFSSMVSNLDGIRITTHDSGTGYSNYFDALGYSWDPNYIVNDSLVEGLLLSYENTTNLDWKGYSLDDTANKTILGNTTLPMPTNGLHSIQVFGNDSLGSMHASNQINFTVDVSSSPIPYLYITSPQDSVIYSEPLSGYYPATYGFENDVVGANPIGWVTIELGASISVIGEYYGHNKVVRIDEGDSDEGRDGILYNSDTPLLNGTFELYWRFSDLQNDIYLQSRDYAGDIGFTLGLFTDLDWRYRRENGVYPKIPNVDSPQTNYWHHVRVDFRFSGAPEYLGLTENRYCVIIDGISSGELQFHSAQSTNFYSLRLGNGPLCERLMVHYDAIGFSWDPIYSVGDNLKKGLLVSYTSTTNLDWVGFSLDGGSNITITGNRVIPFPENGYHSIILSGTTSLGESLRSNLINFSTYVFDPYVPPIPPPPPELTSRDPYIIASIGVGIIALLGIALTVFRKRIFRQKGTVRRNQFRKRIFRQRRTERRKRFRFCPFCGAPIKNKYQFCVDCGESLKKI